MVPSFVLSHVPPCDVPQGYASVVSFPAALLDDHFEHPTRQSAHRIEEALLLPFIAQRSALHVEIAHFQRVGLDEVSSGLDLVAHQNGEDFVDPWHIFQFNLQQRPDFWIHRRFPELIRIHFAKTFVTLDTEPVLALIEDRLDQLNRLGLELFLIIGFDLVRRTAQADRRR